MKYPEGHKVRCYHGAVGQTFRMRDNAEYTKLESGALVRTNRSTMTKKERNRLKKASA